MAGILIRKDFAIARRELTEELRTSTKRGSATTPSMYIEENQPTVGSQDTTDAGKSTPPVSSGSGHPTSSSIFPINITEVGLRVKKGSSEWYNKDARRKRHKYEVGFQAVCKIHCLCLCCVYSS